MGFNNVDVMVGGPNKPSSTYKTKVLKGNQSFASQITDSNTRYIIRWDFNLNGASLEVVNTNSAETVTTVNTSRVETTTTYYTSVYILESGKMVVLPEGCVLLDKRETATLIFPSNKYVNTSGNNIELLLGSTVQGNKTITVCDLVEIPQGCVLSFEGGSINGGVLCGNKTIIEASEAEIFRNTSLCGSWENTSFYPEWFGAKVGDRTFDSTKAIQEAIDAAGFNIGGIVTLSQGTYYFTTLYMRSRVSIIGKGVGVSVLTQRLSCKGNGIVVDGLCVSTVFKRFSLFGSNIERNTERSITGNAELYPYTFEIESSEEAEALIGDSRLSEGVGIVFYPTLSRVAEEGRNTGAGAWNTEQIGSTYSAYKRGLVDDVMVAFFNDGIHVGNGLFCIYIVKSYISDNFEKGLFYYGTDGFVDGCYIHNNGHYGVIINGSNNKVSNCKVHFNGESRYKTSTAIGFAVYGHRNSISNIETQDNYGSGFFIYGRDNMLTNCIADRNGYHYPTMSNFDVNDDRYGFRVGSPRNGNKFYGCVVTHYMNNSFYSTPIKIDNLSSGASCKEIFDGIHISCSETSIAAFRNPHYFSDKTISNVHLEGSNIAVNRTANILGQTVEDEKIAVPYISSQSGYRIDIADKNIHFNDKFTIVLKFSMKDAVNGLGPNDSPVKRDLLVFNGTPSVQKLLIETSKYVSPQRSRYLITPLLKFMTSPGVYDTPGVGYIEGKNATDPSDPTTYSKAHNGEMVTLILRFNGERIRSTLYSMNFNTGQYSYANYVYDYYSTDELLESITINENLLINQLLITTEEVTDTYFAPGIPLGTFAQGSAVYINSDNFTIGTTMPTFTNGSNIGYCLFNKDINKPLWWNGTAWVDATGATV